MSFEEIMDNNAARVQRPLSYVIRIILLLGIGYAIYAHLWRVLFIDVLLLILVMLPSLFKRYDVELPREVDFILLIFVIGSFFLGEIRGIIIQAFFGLAIGFVSIAFIMIITNNSKLKISSFFTYASAISISMGVGAMSELAKFWLKIYFGYEIRLIDYNYAMASLVFVLIGSIIATSLTLAYVRDVNLPILGHLIKRFK